MASTLARLSAEAVRRAAHQHYDEDGRAHPDEAGCGYCGRTWCYTCHPTPSTLCPWCNGDTVDYPRQAAIRRARTARR